jgi:hypothetical protein
MNLHLFKLKTSSFSVKRLKIIFKLLANEGLKLKLSKCDFFKTKIKYLGHLITVNGFHHDNKKITLILNYPEPQNEKQLLSFLGLVNYYRKFVRSYAEIAHYLTELTKKSSTWIWEENETFRRDKKFSNQQSTPKVTRLHPGIFSLHRSLRIRDWSRVSTDTEYTPLRIRSNTGPRRTGSSYSICVKTYK